MSKPDAPESTDRQDDCEHIARIQSQPAVLRALMDLYARVDARVAARNVTCHGDGSCCRFAEAGHRLFVSPLELALLTLDNPPSPQLLGQLRCPYQVGSQCTARSRRPLGCRTYFCQDGSAGWSGELYEEFHAEIAGLHEEHDLAYEYRELSVSVATVFPPDRNEHHRGRKSPRLLR